MPGYLVTWSWEGDNPAHACQLTGELEELTHKALSDFGCGFQAVRLPVCAEGTRILGVGITGHQVAQIIVQIALKLLSTPVSVS